MNAVMTSDKKPAKRLFLYGMTPADAPRAALSMPRKPAKAERKG